mgnify:CR=1 FL=1
MIERNKKLIITLTIVLLATNVIAVPFVIIFNKGDFIPLFNLVLALVLLLLINHRSRFKFQLEYHAKKYNKKPDEKALKEWKDKQRIYWITFGITIIVMLISTLITFI